MVYPIVDKADALILPFMKDGQVKCYLCLRWLSPADCEPDADVPGVYDACCKVCAGLDRLRRAVIEPE